MVRPGGRLVEHARGLSPGPGPPPGPSPSPLTSGRSRTPSSAACRSYAGTSCSPLQKHNVGDSWTVTNDKNQTYDITLTAGQLVFGDPDVDLQYYCMKAISQKPAQK